MGEINLEKWHPDPTIIHYLTAQMVTSSLIINKDIDLKQWIVRHMVNKYQEIFEDTDEFDRWADSMVDFIINHYNDRDVPAELYDNWDFYMCKIATAFVEELRSYPTNPYIEHYIDLLNKYIYG